MRQDGAEIEKNRIRTRGVRIFFCETSLYIAFSILAFALDMGLLSAATRLAGLPVGLSACLGFVGGGGLMYHLMRKFSGWRLTRKQAPLFIASGLLGLAVNQAAIMALTIVLQAPPEAAKIPAAAASLLANYIARRTLFRSVPNAQAEVQP
jgi:putative flippase GtrA